MCLPIEDVETIDRCFASVLSTWRGIIICTWQAVIPFSERVTLDIIHQAARYGCLCSVVASVDGPGLEPTVVEGMFAL